MAVKRLWTAQEMITHAEAVAGVRFSPAFVCLSVFCTISPITDAAGITKLDIQMFHIESWETIYFGVKRSNVTSHKNSAGVGSGTLVSDGVLVEYCK